MEYECYDEFWLYKDVDNMAYIFEYCPKYCLKEFGVKINQAKFLEAFMKAKIRKEMETGHPQLLSESGRDTVVKFVKVDLDGDLSKFARQRTKKYRPGEMYWVGQMYAYIHFRSKLPSRIILKKLPIKDMLQYYYGGNEMSEDKFYEVVKVRVE